MRASTFFGCILLSGFLALPSVANAQPQSEMVGEILDDGSILIDGQPYSEVAPLKSELKILNERHVTLVIRSKSGMRFEAVGKAIMLLQEAGSPKVGFIVQSPNP